MVQLWSALFALVSAAAVVLPDVAVATNSETPGVVAQDKELPAHHASVPAWEDTVREKLLERLGAAEHDGLAASAYAMPAYQEGDIPQAERDRLLTEAITRYAVDLRLGRVDPRETGQDWQHARQAFDAAGFVATLAETADFDLLEKLPPPHPGYARLRDALAHYRDLRDAGGWNSVPFGPLIEPGGIDARIPAIRQRLLSTGDYAGEATGATYDDTLVAAIRAFQTRHGLEPDGIIGRRTVSAMNVPVEERIEQIIVNMERWRWLPREFEANHITVNIAAAQLEVVEDGKPALSMRVIVGTPAHKTPSFRASISSVTLNPAWNVPYSIASSEILPALKRHPGYLIANGLRIVNAFPAGSPQEDGLGINWSRYSHFPYQLRQIPGPDNALGSIKFNMPNANSVFLHDTPSRHLFDKARRTFSHGCVRVAQPLLLASHIGRRPEVTVETLQDGIDTGVTKTIRLAEPWPVYLFYVTAWGDEQGTLQFRDDVYDYDKLLSAALRRLSGAKPPPA